MRIAAIVDKSMFNQDEALKMATAAAEQAGFGGCPLAASADARLLHRPASSVAAIACGAAFNVLIQIQRSPANVCSLFLPQSYLDQGGL